MTDEIIGFEFTNGRVCYCPRAAVTNADGGYLSARFGSGAMIPAGSERTDSSGRNVYFIARDGDLFGNHILPFILTNRPGQLPPFPQAPELWRALREEALFYALDSLTESLKVTHSCDKNDAHGRGVLHWLGTEKGRSDYKNPFVRGLVDVTGWPMTMSREEIEAQGETYNMSEIVRASAPSSLQVLVEYRPPVRGGSAKEENRCFDSLHGCYLLWCDHSAYRLPAIVDMKITLLRPTAYSLRYAECYGARNWNFEASEDGVEWVALHKARDDPHLTRPSHLDQGIKEMIEHAQDENEQKAVVEQANEALTTYVEMYLRHTWNLNTSEFFRYFRILGIGNRENFGCIHVVGLELFGDVQEI